MVTFNFCSNQRTSAAGVVNTAAAAAAAAAVGRDAGDGVGDSSLT